MQGTVAPSSLGCRVIGQFHCIPYSIHLKRMGVAIEVVSYSNLIHPGVVRVHKPSGRLGVTGRTNPRTCGCLEGMVASTQRILRQPSVVLLRKSTRHLSIAGLPHSISYEYCLSHKNPTHSGMTPNLKVIPNG